MRLKISFTLCLISINLTRFVNSSDQEECYAKYLEENNSKIAIALVATGNHDFKWVSIKNKQEYAALHRYDLIISEELYYHSLSPN